MHSKFRRGRRHTLSSSHKTSGAGHPATGIGMHRGLSALLKLCPKDMGWTSPEEGVTSKKYPNKLGRQSDDRASGFFQLFFEVCTMNPVICCFTRPLPHLGHFTLRFSYSLIDITTSNGFLQFWHRYSYVGMFTPPLRRCYSPGAKHPLP